jgi:hypothetical protein
MGIAKWAAVAVTVLMGLANLGLLTQNNLGLQILGPVLAAAAVVAVVGYAIQTSWGAAAVISVGAANLVGSLVGATTGLEGWPVALVLSVLAIVLVAVARPGIRRAVTS